MVRLADKSPVEELFGTDSGLPVLAAATSFSIIFVVAGIIFLLLVLSPFVVDPGEKKSLTDHCHSNHKKNNNPP
jgi:hypothetical protein